MIDSNEIHSVPEYSAEALNVLNYFHDCDVVIFVEGDDDILFWNVISNKAGLLGARIEVAGCKNELLKKIEKIINEDASIIVACDRDHSPFCQNIFENKQVVQPYGYSIENSMYCPSSISNIIRKLSRTLIKYDLIAEQYFIEFINNCRDLLIYDIANHRCQKGVSVFGDNCTKFLKSNKSVSLSTYKIALFIKSIKTNFQEEEILEVKELIETEKRELRYLIKGHFLTNAIINIIKKRVAEVSGRHVKSFSTEHLYTECVDYCKNCNPDDCKGLRSMADNLKIAYNEVKNRQQRH